MLDYSYQAKRLLVKLRRGLRWWPWAASVGIHLGVLAVLSAFVFVSFSTGRDRSQIVPDARLGRVNPKLPLFYRGRQSRKLLPERMLKKQFTDQLAPKISSGKARDDGLDIIALGQSSRSDARSSDLGQLTPMAPRTTFFNAYGNAYVVVYVVDRSGSMIDTIGPLKRELKRSLSELKPMQKFHVIFFSAGRPVEGPAGSVTWASDRNKRRYFEFIDGIGPEGKTDPQWAVKRALELDPDLIYLLTDGMFRQSIADRIIELAKARKVRINTIAYVLERGGYLLREIAERTGGIYRFVSEDQLEW